ncbi:SEC23-interacting protein isoform X2 [Nasonia vitripennis]|uniref:DDHD domain-containing protein n=1 Tax=Nasonia vitripennis TaxID=7425 RepID=A0A7M7H8X9_NASVI|nr:SEC23-interacting protein isoform X2 [Nasonia vitripennis]
MQQQPSSMDSSMVARNKLRNPLLSVAQTEFDSFQAPALLVPVTPATPAVLQDDPVPAAELDSFIGQAPATLPGNVSPSLTLSSPQEQSPQAPPPQQQQQQPQKQGYFTSILSSLPNLSLSAITGETQQPQQQQQYNPTVIEPSYTFHGSPQGYASGPYGAPPSNPYEYRGAVNQPQGLGDFNAGIAPPAAPPQQPQAPPPAVPPSGGAASYRLGNQRRLKYAPPPDLTSSAAQTQHYQPPPLPSYPSAQSNPTSAPPTFFNPNTQIYNPAAAATSPRIDSHSPSAPIISGPPSSQGSSLHSSFRSSPVATPPSGYSVASPVATSPVTSFTIGAPPTSAANNHHFATAPQAIPSRFPEPATPQNTPADVFSGFNAYRQQQQQQQQAGGNFGFNEPPKSSVVQPSGQLDPIKEGSTFAPISAAKVTEKLENLIAAEQSDDAQSVKSEFSAEVATITSKIPEDTPPTTATEELTEIDLNASGGPDVLAPSSEIKFTSETQPPPSQSLDSFVPTVPSATSFFVNPPVSNQNVPSFYNSPFQAQQPITDPFSFIQSGSSSSVTDSANLSGPPITNSKQSLNVGATSPSIEPPQSSGHIGHVDFAPQSIWEPNPPQGHLTVLNPVYGAPVQSAPTFFNPSQFQPTSQSFPSTPSNPYAQAPIGSNIGRISSSSSSPSCQLPQVPQEGFNVVPEPTGSATLSPVQISVNPLTNRTSQETVPPSLQNLAAGLPEKQMQYRPVYHHWFYRREVEAKTLWLPFSMHDSLNLEDIHNSNEISPETKVATDGGRYDVEILRRHRSPVYWTGPITEVRRCSWFYKGPAESRYTPYEESVAARLEEEFKQACTSNNWNRRVDLNNGEYIIFHSPTVQVHYLQATTPELSASWGNNSGSEDTAYLQGATSRPRVVKRGLDEFNIDDGEPEKVDHLLFLVHGIGSVCDLKFRSVEEVVDEFRSISLQLVQSHYRTSSEQGIVNRIEVLPISWHATLHSGIDKKLQVITLESIPKLRHFTNDTLLDILFYTSPIYCETIMQTVGNEMNRLYSLFNQRNPEFQGNVYLGGHSLGSLIMFDLLCHQNPPSKEEKEANGETEESKDTDKESDEASSVIKPLAAPVLKRKLSKKVSYVMGTAGTGQPYINYPQLAFQPRAFFAFGSPIGMFVTVRGIDNLGEDFTLPTCPAFFNIFHPFDPVAYRVESLVTPEAHKYRPMLIPHHKGRKRMHLELKETMARVGADLKQKLLESVRSTWNSVYQLAMFHRQDNRTLEQEIEKVVDEQMSNPPIEPVDATVNDDAGADYKVGKLNGGRRIDYVLQEAPLEYINEYLFALTSHVCYWESEDTMLLILKEIYGSMGIQTDAQLPQQTLSIERVSTPSISASPSNVTSPTAAAPMYVGMDPTAPISAKPVGPPPTVGFVRKS